MKDNEIHILALSIATNQFTVPLPTGAEVVEAVNNHDRLVAENAELKSACEAALEWIEKWYSLDAVDLADRLRSVLKLNA